MNDNDCGISVRTVSCRTFLLAIFLAVNVGLVSVTDLQGSLLFCQKADIVENQTQV